ncbi:MAG: hypothetical protein E6G62_07780 [Actinobacteria bacterium]|nr:MAG: hypothetical protein E6G62_07780 [Actinomycetota bacterium]
MKVPQEATLSPSSLAEADARKTTITLPQGVLLNPAAADGLLACTGEQVGFAGPNEATQINNNEFSASPPACPDQAKVGTVKIKTPVLKKPLEGSVYLASQNTNPFRSPLVLYIIAQDPESGVLVKLAGTTTADPVDHIHV